MISTPAELAARLNIDGPALAIAAQTIPGGVTEYLRVSVISHGESNLCGRGPNGKVERYGECFERVTGQKLRPKRKK